MFEFIRSQISKLLKEAADENHFSDADRRNNELLFMEAENAFKMLLDLDKAIAAIGRNYILFLASITTAIVTVLAIKLLSISILNSCIIILGFSFVLLLVSVYVTGYVRNSGRAIWRYRTKLNLIRHVIFSRAPVDCEYIKKFKDSGDKYSTDIWNFDDFEKNMQDHIERNAIDFQKATTLLYDELKRIFCSSKTNSDGPPVYQIVLSFSTAGSGIAALTIIILPCVYFAVYLFFSWGPTLCFFLCNLIHHKT